MIEKWRSTLETLIGATREFPTRTRTGSSTYGWVRPPSPPLPGLTLTSGLSPTNSSILPLSISHTHALYASITLSMCICICRHGLYAFPFFFFIFTVSIYVVTCDVDSYAIHLGISRNVILILISYPLIR